MTNPNMPKYRSHKEVNAGEIKMISLGKEAIVSFTDYVPTSCFTNEEFKKMTERYKPVAGDFLVVYPDGYQSFSPRKAFLEGYTKL